MFGIGSMMPLPGWRPKPTPRDVAREFIAYYTGPERHPAGGCGNCGGLPHSSTCFVGRFIAALDEGATDPAIGKSEDDGKAIGSALGSSSPAASKDEQTTRDARLDEFRREVYDKLRVVYDGAHMLPLQRTMALKQCQEFLIDLFKADRETRIPAREDWRPIETAPTDGRWYLGWNADCGHFVWRDGPGLLTGEDPAPTHWMSLPPPPSDEPFELDRDAMEPARLLRQLAQVVGARDLFYAEPDDGGWTQVFTASARRRIARRLSEIATSVSAGATPLEKGATESAPETLSSLRLEVSRLSLQLQEAQTERDEARRDVVRMASAKIGHACHHHSYSQQLLETLALRECPICWKACAEAAETTAELATKDLADLVKEYSTLLEQAEASESSLTSLSLQLAGLRKALTGLITKWRHKPLCSCGSGQRPTCTEWKCDACCRHRADWDTCTPLYMGTTTEEECADQVVAALHDAQTTTPELRDPE